METTASKKFREQQHSRRKLLDLLEKFNLYKRDFPGVFVGKNAILYVNGVEIGHVTNVSMNASFTLSKPENVLGKFEVEEE